MLYQVISDPVEYPYLMVKEAEEAEGAPGAGGEVFWLGCLIMVNHPDLISGKSFPHLFITVTSPT